MLTWTLFWAKINPDAGPGSSVAHQGEGDRLAARQCLLYTVWGPAVLKPLLESSSPRQVVLLLWACHLSTLPAPEARPAGHIFQFVFYISFQSHHFFLTEEKKIWHFFQLVKEEVATVNAPVSQSSGWNSSAMVYDHLFKFVMGLRLLSWKVWLCTETVIRLFVLIVALSRPHSQYCATLFAPKVESIYMWMSFSKDFE